MAEAYSRLASKIIYVMESRRESSDSYREWSGRSFCSLVRIHRNTYICSPRVLSQLCRCVIDLRCSSLGK